MAYKIPASVKPALWSAVAGAIAMSIVGFSLMGWTLGSTAERLAKDRAETAVVKVLTPICVEKFMAQADAPVQLSKFKVLASWDQRSNIEKGGWANGVGDKSPPSELLSACAAALSAKELPAKSAEAKTR